MHIESNGGKVIDVIANGAHNLQSEDPFKGDLDIEKLGAVFREHGRQKVSCIYVELSVNACGGHPVSLGNLKKVKALAATNGVPLFLDACRILENSYLIRQREAGYHDRSIREIVFETCESADGCTMSAMKDLLVPIGGMIGSRDPVTFQKATMQSFLDGAQPPASAMQMISTALEEIFAVDAYVTAGWSRLTIFGVGSKRESHWCIRPPVTPCISTSPRFCRMWLRRIIAPRL